MAQARGGEEVCCGEEERGEEGERAGERAGVRVEGGGEGVSGVGCGGLVCMVCNWLGGVGRGAYQRRGA